MHQAERRRSRRGRIARVLLACLGATTAAAAQNAPIELARVHPQFTGTWGLVRHDITRAPGAPGTNDPLSPFTFGSSVTIRQTASAIQIAAWDVRFDGTIAIGSDGSTMSAAWEGDALAINRREPAPAGAPSSDRRVVLRLSADGMLTMDITSTPVTDVVSVHSVYQRATGVGTADASGVFTPGRGITAPVLLHEEKPAYTRQAVLAQIQGPVELDITVLADGTVDLATITVTKSLDKTNGLDDQARAAAKLWRFKPGVEQATGRVVPCRVSIVMTFKLGE